MSPSGCAFFLFVRKVTKEPENTYALCHLDFSITDGATKETCVFFQSGPTFDAPSPLNHVLMWTVGTSAFNIILIRSPICPLITGQICLCEYAPPPQPFCVIISGRFLLALTCLFNLYVKYFNASS